MLYCSVANVRALFDKYRLYLTDDIRKGLVNALGKPGYAVPHEQLMNILILKLIDMFANCGEHSHVWSAEFDNTNLWSV